MKQGWYFRTVSYAVIFLSFATLASSCGGPSKEVITKQREGLVYQVSYQKAFQCVIFTLTKKGIGIDKIDEKKGFIITLPQQIREERYIYQIAIRPIEMTKTAVSVICIWSITPGVDVYFYGIPSAVAKSKSKKLEIELADDIHKEIMEVQIEKSEI